MERKGAILSILCAVNLALAACSEAQPEPLTAYEPSNNLGDIVLGRNNKSWTISKPAEGWVKVAGNSITIDWGLRHLTELRQCDLGGEPQALTHQGKGVTTDALYFRVKNDCFPDVPLYGARKFYPPEDWVEKWRIQIGVNE